MPDDDVDVGPNDEVEAALVRMFDDAWNDAQRPVVDDPVGWPGSDAVVTVSAGEVEELDESRVALRSASVLAERSLRVAGAGFDVVVDVARSDDHLDVRGTVFGVDEPCSVQLLHDVDEVALAVTDELGEFALLGVAPGRYELVVAAARTELSADLDLT